MIPLSRPVKEAIKVALSVVIAMGIAVWMDWSKPLWAGFAVAIIALPTEGESLNRGAMRMLGTLIAVAVGLALISIYGQQRWLYMILLSVYIAFCAYMMTGAKRQYLWYASGFVSMVVAADASTSMTPFQVAVERSQETGTGILVYSLVASFLWPVTTRTALESASRKLVAVQGDLCRAYLAIMRGQARSEESRTQRQEEVQLLTQTEQLLNVAESESYEVWEVRHQWRRFHGLSHALAEALGHWRVSLSQIDGLDPARFLPGLEALWPELDARFAEIGRMLDGHAPTRTPQAVDVAVDREAIRTLTRFQRAAVILTKNHLERIEALSRALFDSVRDLKDFGEAVAPSPLEEAPRRAFAIDIDRMQGVVLVLTVLWAAFLIWVYLDPPGHAGFVFISAVYVMVIVRTGAPVWNFVVWQCIGALVAGIPYIFIMPHLSTYLQIGFVMFAMIFAMHFFFSGGARMALLINFIATLSLQNEQSYNFSAYANATAKTFLVAALLVTVVYVLTYPRKERVFVRLLRRFFRHAAFLMSELEAREQDKRGVLHSLKAAFYRRDLLSLPIKLAAVGERIDHRAISANSAEQVRALVASLFVLAFNIKGLVEAKQLPQAEVIKRALGDEGRVWRQYAEERFRLRAEAPVFAAENEFVEQYAADRLDRLEARVEETLATAGEGALNDADIESFCRLLGSYRGMSEAGLDLDRAAAAIDWAHWGEARF